MGNAMRSFDSLPLAQDDICSSEYPVLYGEFEKSSFLNYGAARKQRWGRRMSILGHSEILKEIEAGRIVIDPYDPESVGPASVDLRLSNAFRVFVRLPRNVAVTDAIDFRAATKGLWVEDDDYLIMRPGETVLGMTQERVELAENLCGWLEGRSRFARLGLLVHISASFMQPGISNHQVLEMSNFGPIPLEIRPGTAICQFIFQRIEGTGRYQGVFQDQTPRLFARD